MKTKSTVKDMRNKTISLVALALVGLLLGGCASTSQVLPKVADEKPTADKALITLERPTRFFGGQVTSKVFDNTTYVGTLAAGGKMAWLRDPGPMELLISGQSEYGKPNGHGNYCGGKKFTAKNITVVAGERFDYKVLINLSTPHEPMMFVDDGSDLEGFNLIGPGIPSKTDEQSKRGDALVFFRLITDSAPDYTYGALKVVNIKTKEPINFTFDHLNQPWRMLYLPVGEYYVSGIEVDSVTTGFDSPMEMAPEIHFQPNGVTTWSQNLPHVKNAAGQININAEFDITKTNTAIYVGDVTFSKERISIGKDSDAARAFQKQNCKELPYSESAMLINK